MKPIWPFRLGDRDRSREPAPLIVQVTRASRRCLPAAETLPPPSQGALSTRAVCSITWGATPALDAGDDLPKQRTCQVTFGELQGEVPGMPDEAAAGLEEP